MNPSQNLLPHNASSELERTPADHSTNDSLTLIDRLLLEQQQISAVDDFSRQHDSGVPAQAKYYSKLIPASAPKPGEQYAFEVDLDRCSGCKACVTACHALNGLDENETWREVGILIGGDSQKPVMQHVTTACHHCVEPGCLIGCPVNAYTKDPATGIVKHLDDQCFGCQYCTLACPYEVPQFHAEKGIVRKCDMCSDRLAVGEAPACVQACPHEAISIRTVNVHEVAANAELDPFLPGAPSPSITQPTTHYKTSRNFPRNTLPGDYHALKLQHAHWPLIVMLVLTQLWAGGFLFSAIGQSVNPGLTTSLAAQIQTLVSLVIGFVALGASTLHLGRPQYAFRGMLGILHSWLSREIAAFGAFAGLTSLATLIAWQPYLAGLGVPEFPASARIAIAWMTAIVGLIGVFCSIMIYDFTKRSFWSFPRTATKFFLTTVILGLGISAFSMSTAAWLSSEHPMPHFVPAITAILIGIACCSAAKLLFEGSLFLHLKKQQSTPLKKSALLSWGPLKRSLLIRNLLGLIGGVAVPLLVLNLSNFENISVGLVLGIFVIPLMCLVGEILERYQFFAAVSPPRMPGNVTP